MYIFYLVYSFIFSINSHHITLLCTIAPASGVMTFTILVGGSLVTITKYVVCPIDALE